MGTSLSPLEAVVNGQARYPMTAGETHLIVKAER
jgi:hypothetical protein